VGEELYRIMKSMNEMTPEKLADSLRYLQVKWEPIIQGHYSRMFSSLIENVIDLI